MLGLAGTFPIKLADLNEELCVLKKSAQRSSSPLTRCNGARGFTWAGQVLVLLSNCQVLQSGTAGNSMTQFRIGERGLPPAEGPHGIRVDYRAGVRL
jgi:hypothetical protein